MKDTHSEGIDQYFPQFIRLTIDYSWLGEDMSEYENCEKILNKSAKTREELMEITKRLREEFQTADLEVPRNFERHVLFQFILESHPLKADHGALSKELVAQLETFQDLTALAWGIEILFELSDVEVSEGVREEIQLTAAEMAAKANDTQKAIDLFHNAFNRQKEDKVYLFYRAFDRGKDIVRTRLDLYPFGPILPKPLSIGGVRHFFFEDSSFARNLQELISPKQYRAPRIVHLTEYPHLKALYQTAPFTFFAPWDNKDKLQLVLDVISWISFPFHAYDHALFQKFRQLIKPIREACLKLEEFDKYFDLAEIFARNGNELVSFKLYGLLCQELKKEVLKWPILPYLGSRHLEHRDWDPPYFHHARGDGKYPRPRIHQNKALFQFLEKVPVDLESGLFAEILEIFLGDHSWFDKFFREDHVSLFKALILNHPGKIRAFCSQLKEWNPLTVRLIFTLPPEIMDKELNPMLENVKKVDSTLETLWEDYPFFSALLADDLRLKLSEFKPIFGRLVKVEWVLQQLRNDRQTKAELNQRLAELQQSLTQIDTVRGTALFASVIPALQQWQKEKGRNLSLTLLDKITHIFYQEFCPL